MRNGSTRSAHMRHPPQDRCIRKADDSCAREPPLASAPGARRPPNTRVMSGTPLKRQRRNELRCVQPRIPVHQWRTFCDTEKIIAIFGMSLDEVLELMPIPFAEADLHERNLKLRVFECMMKAGLQFHPRQRTRQCTQRTPRATGAALRADKQDVSWIRRAHLFRCCDTLGAGDPVFFARRSRKNAKLGAVSEARRNLLAARSTG